MESKNFEDLYAVLNADFGSSKKDILKNYKNSIKYYQNKIINGAHLNDEERWNVKLLKIAKYVLTTDTLRKKYNMSQIMIDSEETNENKQEEQTTALSNKYSDNKYTEINKFDIPLRKDTPIDLKAIGDRQFERFEHNNFDLSKDRELRGSVGGI
jgi:hypothetical protein